MGTVHVRGLRVGQRWELSMEDDPTPFAGFDTRAEAEREARAHAQTFGHDRIIVHEIDGDELLMRLADPDPQPHYPGRNWGAPGG